MRSLFDSDPFTYLKDNKNLIDEYYKLKDQLNLTFKEKEILERISYGTDEYR